MLGFREQIAKNTLIFNHHNNIRKKRKITRNERLDATQTAKRYGDDLIKAKRWLEICQ